MQFKYQFKWIPVLLSILILCVPALPSVAESAGPEYDLSSLNYELVWADEFDTDGLPDPARWTYNTGGNGWGNGEQQYYMAEGNAAIEDGILTIELREEKKDYSSYYTSARMLTQNLGDWLYCKIEVRAKLPSGRGTWPAIWMLPTDRVYGDWPASGEIDIMEKLKGASNIVVIDDYTVVRNSDSNSVLIRMELLTNLGEYIMTRQISMNDILKIGVTVQNPLFTAGQSRHSQQKLQPKPHKR